MRLTGCDGPGQAWPSGHTGADDSGKRKSPSSVSVIG